MRTSWLWALAAAGAVLALPAHAQPPRPPHAGAVPPGYVDAYFIPTAEINFDFSGDQADFEGDGFGVRAALPVGPLVTIHGEYDSFEYDEASVSGFGSGPVDLEESQLRLGVGLHGTGEAGTLSVVAEYIKDEVEFEGNEGDIDGYALHLRGDLAAGEILTFYGQIGYLALEDDSEELDGPEFLVGGAINLTPFIGVFVDYRSAQLEYEFGDEVELNVLRTGVRFNL